MRDYDEVFPDEKPLVTFELTLSRTIHPDGQQGFVLSTPEKFSFIEALGLLEAGKWQLYKQMSDMFGEF